MTNLVDLLVEEAGWLDAVPELEDVAEAAARLALEARDLDPQDYEVSLLACDDNRMAALNEDHRDKPQPTNVLSWPAFDLAPEVPGASPAVPPESPIPGPMPLGDVAIALQTCVREASLSAKPLKFHVMHLILHGCLHLLGYDHLRSEDAAIMEGLESRLLINSGWPDPYA